MSHVIIKLKDGTVRDFPHEGRAGGSYTKSVKFEGGWVIVTDEWGKRIAFPAQDVTEVEDRPERGRW